MLARPGDSRPWSLPQKHIKEHHEEVRERPCPHPGCNKVFMIDRYLQRHVKLIHTGVSPPLQMELRGTDTEETLVLSCEFIVVCFYIIVCVSCLVMSDSLRHHGL